ncbi:MerR family transcriptional regulator [Gudongella sp. SC589]|uniref:MerR family transcriptional regulator n=1 Tax=Gudongella sp. SC589 TaxID=3385990 RepID=UPI003904A809
MKIGEFAARNKTTIDTIRHYMDLSLLTPEKKGSYYVFNEDCQKDYNTVLSLKHIGFSLVEIQTLMLYDRIGRHTEYSRQKTYRAFFLNKLQWIQDELLRLKDMEEKLQETLESMPGESDDPHPAVGVPFNALPHLFCNECESSYVLSEGQVENGMIISGRLTCHCRDSLEIRGGILFGKGALSPEMCDAVSNSFIDDYVNTTHVDYLKNLHMSLQWARNNYDFPDQGDGIVLELGSGRGFFLRNVIDILPGDSLYIAVDHNPNALAWLKDSLADVIGGRNILFLCCDFKSIPLKPHAVATMIDATGSSNYAFEHEDFLLDSLMQLLADNSTLYGHYLAFENFAPNSVVPEKSRQWFRRDIIKRHLDSLGFRNLREYETAPISQGGPREDFFVKGERIFNYLYMGKLSS